MPARVKTQSIRWVRPGPAPGVALAALQRHEARQGQVGHAADIGLARLFRRLLGRIGGGLRLDRLGRRRSLAPQTAAADSRQQAPHSIARTATHPLHPALPCLPPWPALARLSPVSSGACACAPLGFTLPQGRRIWKCRRRSIMPAARLTVVVTRRLPEAVETRMKELFDVELRDPDIADDPRRAGRGDAPGRCAGADDHRHDRRRPAGAGGRPAEADRQLRRGG